MHMKRYTLILILSVCLLTPVQHAAAQSPQQQFIAELNRLVEQLLELQRSQGAAASGYDSRSLTASEYHDGSYEAIYRIENDTLHPYGNTIFRALDVRFWELWRTVIGEETARSYFTELRLYRDDAATYDAFVERIEDDNWILGVNIAGIDITNRLDRSLMVELFVHEYAHLLHYYYPEVAADFNDRFWSERSYREYDHVSEYAMQSAEEDFAESFMYYVLDLTPEGGGRAQQKIGFFSEHETFERIRAGILGRLR